nr:pyruvate kinase [Kocuria sp. JC486]
MTAQNASMPGPPTRKELAGELYEVVGDLIEHLRDSRRRSLPDLQGVTGGAAASAVNLVDYVAVRGLDIRNLQRGLASLGVSSLGHMESDVMEHLVAVRATLAAVLAQDGSDERPTGQLEAGTRSSSAAPDSVSVDPVPSVSPGTALLARNTEEIFGPALAHRNTRIMVTLPSEAAEDHDLVRDYVTSGTDLARINCAHDGPGRWSRMIQNVRAAGEAAGRGVKIAMDLGGPKLRTGPIQPGPRVRRIKPRRDVSGAVVEPARAWLVPRDHPTDPTPAALDGGLSSIPVNDVLWLQGLGEGEDVSIRDARGSRRRLRVLAVHADRVLVESRKSVSFATGLELTDVRGAVAIVDELPVAEMSFRVREGDLITLTRDMAPTDAADGAPVVIGCSLPEAFEDAEAGQRVLIDDGKLGTAIRSVDPDRMVVEVTRCRPGGVKLKAEKGLKFPDTSLRLSALSPQDRENLPFVAEHADILQLSFARSPQDVDDLLEALARIQGAEIDVVLKIETVSGFQSLPQMLLRILGRTGCAVMIARGDLAVEARFERLVELQEEIIWLCEAARVPVVWATQVLESQARSGLPSRAQVTDAGAGQRAECVMLNKGPLISGAIATLDSILGRMDGHLSKKADLLRRLESWDPQLR